jgi:hypothetical protein
MAGEWIPIDIALDQKPEVQELIDLTGEPVETVCYRMFKLWSWASLNSEDGTVRATPARLGRTCGGDERFWLAVETVGWLAFDSGAGTASIPGWGRRFSQSAKARALHLDRAGRARQASADAAPKRSKSARDECAPAQQKRTREEERTDSSSSSSVVVDLEADGATLRAAWNAAARANPSRVKPYGEDALPQATIDRLEAPGWLSEALKAIDRLPACRMFTTPVNLAQFSGVKNGVTFSRRVIEQQFDNPKEPRGSFGHRPGPDERRTAEQAQADWQRSALDPERARQRAEYLEAQARKRGEAKRDEAARRGDAETEAARAAVLAKIRQEVAS